MTLQILKIGRLTTLLILTVAGCADSPATAPSYFHSNRQEQQIPGSAMNDRRIYRQLLEEGYLPDGSPRRLGAVAFADAHDGSGQHVCLVLNVFSGTILQRLHAGPNGPVADIAAAPGPGYPGFPKALLLSPDLPCEGLLKDGDSDTLVVPGVPEQLLHMRY